MLTQSLHLCRYVPNGQKGAPHPLHFLPTGFKIRRPMTTYDHTYALNLFYLCEQIMWTKTMPYIPPPCTLDRSWAATARPGDTVYPLQLPLLLTPVQPARGQLSSACMIPSCSRYWHTESVPANLSSKDVKLCINFPLWQSQHRAFH